MFPVLPLPHATAALAASSALGAGALASFPRGPLRAWLGRTTGGVALIIAAGLALWATDAEKLEHYGEAISWTGLFVLVPLVLALLASALLARGGARATASRGRRSFLQAGAAALPAVAVTASATGFAGASTPQRLPIVRVRIAHLHPDLEGFRILQLSDLHLGVQFTTVDLVAALDRAAALEPDLIVLTGDVADDLGELERALAIVHERRPRLGVFAALGNHEYMHGISRTRPVYERSAVRLLVDEGETLTVGAAKLHVLGVDDLDGRSASDDDFYRGAVARALAGAPEGAFRLLLCHRPEGFDAAADQAVELTLSGHTHGGQLGAFGVSALTALLANGRVWGLYRKARSQLYTTSGFGHWFPFRLGCPTETPLIVLERA